MRADAFKAEWSESEEVLTLVFHREPVRLTPDLFCDAAYVKKGDTMSVRLTSMTRYAFEDWTKEAAHPAYAAVAAWIAAGERAQEALRDRS